MQYFTCPIKSTSTVASVLYVGPLVARCAVCWRIVKRKVVNTNSRAS